MGGMEFNKVAASVLLAGIVAMVAGIGSEMLYYGGGHHGEEEKRGYSIEVMEEAPAGVAEVEEAPVDIETFMAEANVAEGQKLIKRCTTCHTFEKGGANGVGPNQYGLVGRPIASHEGYPYSAALEAMKGKTWTRQALSEFLHKPKKYIPGNKMAYAGMKNPKDRANLIAYIESLQ